MELDAKHKVLFAIYAEYQKDLPEMRASVTFQALDMECQVFKIAIDKLQNEGLIQGAKMLAGNGPIPAAAHIDLVKMTREGLDYVENKLDIERSLTGKEKVTMLKQKFGKAGWETLSDFAAKVLANMITQSI